MLRKLSILSLTIMALADVCQAQETLLLSPGDTIHVRVFDTPDMDQHPRVNDKGNVPLMFLGDIKLGGLTPGEAASAIETALIEKQLMLHPHVEVTIEDVNTQVSVLGQVNEPGMYVFTTPTSILSVLSAAGGLTELADRHIAIERRGDPHNKVEYFLSNSSKDAMDSDILVNPGDTVLVPKAAVVYVMGDVAKPGGYPIVTNDGKISVMQAVAMEGRQTAQQSYLEQG